MGSWIVQVVNFTNFKVLFPDFCYITISKVEKSVERFITLSDIYAVEYISPNLFQVYLSPYVPRKSVQ